MTIQQFLLSRGRVLGESWRLTCSWHEVTYSVNCKGAWGDFSFWNWKFSQLSPPAFLWLSYALWPWWAHIVSNSLNGGRLISIVWFLPIMLIANIIVDCLVFCYVTFHFIAAREELIKLQRDYRKSEGLRKSITEASQNDIRKQKYYFNHCIK